MLEGLLTKVQIGAAEIEADVLVGKDKDFYLTAMLGSYPSDADREAAEWLLNSTDDEVAKAKGIAKGSTGRQYKNKFVPNCYDIS